MTLPSRHDHSYAQFNPAREANNSYSDLAPLSAGSGLDEKVDDEVLEDIPKEFFQHKFDAIHFELEKLPETLDLQQIHSDRQRIHRQLSVVTKRVFAGILDQQSKCQAEMKRVDEIQNRLVDSLGVCRLGREGLAQARAEFTGSSLGILAAYRRRQQTQQLLNDLNIIRTLQKTDARLQELLGEDNFPGAIQLLLECQKVVTTYSHFKAVKQLATKLQDTLDMTEEQLDVALSKVCIDFNPVMYERVHTAYCLLGKTQTSMDQLHMHLTSAIHNMAWNVVFGHAMLAQESNVNVDLSKKPFQDLCESIATSSVIPCLVDLCRALWGIMNSYRLLVDWHERQRDQVACSEDDEAEEVCSHQEQQYIEKKLATGKTRIWQDVQTKTKIFVLANDISGLGVDHFLEFMDVIHRLIQVGNDFCGSNSDTLQESLKKQCWNYFHIYHLSRLEELTMHFENEGWAQCPVKPSFKVQQLVNLDLSMSSPFDFDFGPLEDDEETFLLESNGDEEGGFYSEENDSDAEIDDALKQDYVDEDGTLPPQARREPQQITGIVNLPELSPMVNLSHPESLFGLLEKFVAVESAVYLSKQIFILKGDISNCLPSDKKSIFSNYESQTLNIIQHLRRPVYMSSVQKSINSDLILQLMAKVSWDIKDVKSQHSQYVEFLLRDFQVFSLRLQEIRKSVHVAGEARKVLWDLCTLCASKIFVEGFSSAKKCSNEGRALMQLDYRQFLLKLEKMSDLKPLPYQEYVSNYVKAYYIPESDLEAWVKQHNMEYTPKQLVALVNCVAYSNNRTKQKLNNLISDLGTRIRREKH
eukprot:snap_masked-scaffold196_size269943-processed-gene-1.9 protein:Tk08145 transcript:snap_masked-scaffold196_size269943-processed-gene-1.9-mRNA-1 annotation:"coiled-coil domain-containing protein 132"